MDVKLTEQATGPLKGLRVLDITTQITGPLCSQQLGDLGADVIKIEPVHGEFGRWMAPPESGGLTGTFTQLNRNKRGLALDLKSEEGVAIIKKLASSADLLVENFRGGVADRLGIGWDDLHPLNTRLIYLAITGFGATGPYSKRPAYDMLAQGLVGMAYIQGKGHNTGPQLIQSAIVDKTTAVTAAGAAMAALYARDGINGTGRGQRVDVPMIDAYAACSLPDMMPPDTFVPSELPEPTPLAVLRAFEAADGHVVGLALQNNHFQAFCEALDCTHLLDKPGNRSLGERIADFEPWLDDMAAEIRKWSVEELLQRLEAAGVPFGPVKTIREFAEDPQARHNRTIFDAEDSRAGTIRYVRYPGHLSDTPAALYRHPPRLGEHNVEILEELGYSASAIEQLREKQVIQ